LGSNYFKKTWINLNFRWFIFLIYFFSDNIIGDQGAESLSLGFAHLNNLQTFTLYLR
jgi:hypothetical protein